MGLNHKGLLPSCHLQVELEGRVLKKASGGSERAGVAEQKGREADLTTCANIWDREMSRNIAKPWYCRQYCGLQN